VPTQLRRWLGVDSERTALAGFDAVLVGGGPADDSLLSEARGAGVSVVTTYGMSETCGGCVYDGLPLDGVGVALDVDGRIRISGPVLFDGYVGRRDLTDRVLQDGWLITPDLGRFADDGRLVVTGRVDDVVVSGGVKVPLPAVERVLSGLPWLEAVCVVGLPHEEWGTEVVAAVSIRELPSEGSLEAVRNAVGSTHDRAWAPRRVLVVDHIPMLESGKPDRQAVARMLDGSQA
jgi:o-succinylbenzoate---CoA ligase